MARGGQHASMTALIRTFGRRRSLVAGPLGAVLPLRPRQGDHDPAPRQQERNDVGYTRRVDWPRGEHHFEGFHRTPGRAQRGVDGVHSYWATSPYRPVSVSVVAMSRHDWDLHAQRQRCRAPDCPAPAGG